MSSEQRRPPRRRVNQHDPPVLGVVPSLDEASRLHPVDDAGHARDRDVEGLGEAAHRHRALGLEERQNVEVGHAHRALVQALNAATNSRGFQDVSSSMTSATSGRASGGVGGSG